MDHSLEETSTIKLFHFATLPFNSATLPLFWTFMEVFDILHYSERRFLDSFKFIYMDLGYCSAAIHIQCNWSTMETRWGVTAAILNYIFLWKPNFPSQSDKTNPLLSYLMYDINYQTFILIGTDCCLVQKLFIIGCRRLFNISKTYADFF